MLRPLLFSDVTDIRFGMSLVPFRHAHLAKLYHMSENDGAVILNFVG